jgi:hypothetical protein
VELDFHVPVRLHVVHRHSFTFTFFNDMVRNSDCARAASKSFLNLRLDTPQARVRSEGRPCGSYGEQCCPGTAYFRSTFFFAYHLLFL